MSLLNGTSHVSAREFTIRTGSNGYEQNGRIHTPDPAAVANLKRILAQQSQAKPRRPHAPSRQRGGVKGRDHIAAILEKAKERKRPSTAEPEKPKIEDKMKKNNRWSLSEEITADTVAGWAKRIRDGETRNQVAKNNELGVSDYIVRRYLEKFGYDRITGLPIGSDEQEPVEPVEERPSPQPAAKAPPVEPAEAEMVPTVAAPATAERALAVDGPPNGRDIATAGQSAPPPMEEQMANLRRLLAELPRGKGIKIHGKISIELEF